MRRPAPTNCPVCASALRIARLGCDECGTAIEGDFESGRLGRLSREQLAFVEVFLECRGKIKDVETQLGLSYPTVVARLDQVVEALGQPIPAIVPRPKEGSPKESSNSKETPRARRADEPPAASADGPKGRRANEVLDALARGEITVDQAATRLRNRT